jgi:hypothetical protein
LTIAAGEFSLLHQEQRVGGKRYRRGQPEVSRASSSAAHLFTSQMADLMPGSIPIAYGNWKKAYTVVWRRAVALQIDPYCANFCTLFKAKASVGVYDLPEPGRLLRINK